MAFAGVLTGLVSAGLGMAQANYQAQVARNNARIATWNAGLTQMKSEIEQQDQDARARGLMGELTAGQGASGIAITSQSAADTRSTAAMLSRQDALRIRQAGAVQAWNFESQASDFRAQAGADQLGGIGSAIGGFLKSASSLVSQASPVSDKWNWMRQDSGYVTA